MGAFPVDDPNPFFFQLNHVASNDCEQEECPFDYSGGSSQDNDTQTTRAEKRQFTVLTYDDLRNVDFYTAAYSCQKNGRDCSLVEVDPYYMLAEVLDLNKSQVQEVDDVNGYKGYTVKGDEKTWVSNGTLHPSFDPDTFCFGTIRFPWSAPPFFF